MKLSCFTGFHIFASFNVNAITAKPQASEEYNKMLVECKLTNSVNFKHCLNNLEVTLLPIRSFNKSAIDLGSDKILKTSDIICLTQRQLKPNAESQSVFSLEEFEMVYNNDADKFQSIATLTLFHLLK